VQLPGVTSALLTLLASRHPQTRDEGALLVRLGHALGIATDRGPKPDADAVAALVQAPPLSQLLAIAADSAERIANHREVHLRHLVLATVLASDPPLRAEVLAELGISPSELRLCLREAARAETTGEPITAWEALLPAVSSISSLLAGGIDTDLVDPTRGIPLVDDHLGAGVWVSMLAAVITDADTPMPLSVGIFGEWGSGKSYFMGLLRSEIDRLSDSKREPYLGHVAQIGFNAWHYADANLWASLGDEIFRQLAGPAEVADESRRRLRRELAESSAERQALDARTALARDEAVKLQAELDAAVAQRKWGASDLLKAVRTSAALREELDKVWRRLGISDETQQARLLADEVRGTAAEASALRSLLGHHRTWVFAGACVIALLTIGAAAWIPASWGRWLGAGGATAVAVILTTGVTVMARAKEGLTRLRKMAADLSSGIAASAEERTAEAVG
ncbi:MAG: P-loop NTPase fold protein, partial [Chloroflexota bacterium]